MDEINREHVAGVSKYLHSFSLALFIEQEVPELTSKHTPLSKVFSNLKRNRCLQMKVA